MEIIYNLGGVVGILALGGILYGMFTRPRLKIKYEAKSDLRQWNFTALNDSSPLQQRKVFTVHVFNQGKKVAQKCEAFVKIGHSHPKVNLLQKVFPLQWADTDYKKLSASMEPVDIIKCPRRLDVLYAESGQSQKGCWIASSQALAMVPDVNQFYLPSGKYNLKVSVTCSNGTGDSKSFKLTMGDQWFDMKIKE